MLVCAGALGVVSPPPWGVWTLSLLNPEFNHVKCVLRVLFCQLRLLNECYNI